MAHIGTGDEMWAWGRSPENAIQRMLEPEKKGKKAIWLKRRKRKRNLNTSVIITVQNVPTLTLKTA